MGYNSRFLNNQPLNVSFAAVPQQVLDGGVFAIQMVFTGSPCMITTDLYVSTDPYNNTPGYVPQHFDHEKDSTLVFTGPGTYTYQVGGGYVGYVWVQLVVTDNSGGTNTGVMSATIQVKNND